MSPILLIFDRGRIQLHYSSTVLRKHFSFWEPNNTLIVIHFRDKNCTRVVSLFNADMHLHLVPSSIAEAFVPRCAVMLMEQMKKCGNFKVEKYDTLPGWA